MKSVAASKKTGRETADAIVGRRGNLLQVDAVMCLIYYAVDAMKSDSLYVNAKDKKR